jgi:DNA polymerase delta subunit 1
MANINGKHGRPATTNSLPATKRSRGGGNDQENHHSNDNNGQDLYPHGKEQDYDDAEDNDDDEEIQQQENEQYALEDEEEEEYETSTAADNADTAIYFDDLSPQQLERWCRPPVPTSALNANEVDLHLQWLDMDVVGGEPLRENPNRNKKFVPGAAKGEVPVIRVYGVTDGGNSVVVFIHGYTPYGYFALPEGFHLAYGNDKDKNVILGKIRQVLNDKLVSAKSTRSKSAEEDVNLVQGVQYVEDCKSIMGYNTSHDKFLKVYLQMPTLVTTLKRIMEEGVTLPGVVAKEGVVARHQWDDVGGGGGGGSSYQAFECNVPFVLRFMVDEDICGAGWLTLPKGTYEIRKSSATTNCQVCIYVSICVYMYLPCWIVDLEYIG